MANPLGPVVKLGRRKANTMISFEKVFSLCSDVLGSLWEDVKFFCCAISCFEESYRYHPADLPYYPWIIEYQIV